jgi:hypothetical protein
MDTNSNREWKKGDSVLVIAWGKIIKTKITRKERNSASNYHTDDVYGTHSNFIFPNTFEGLKAARAALVADREKTVNNYKELLRRAEEDITAPVILSNRNPSPMESRTYVILDNGNVEPFTKS